MKFISEIEKIITDYSKRGDKMGPDEILKLRDRLAASSFYFASYAGELKEVYNLNYFQKKIAVLRETQNLIKAGNPVNKSENDAMLQAEELIRKELESESNAYKADLLLRQINKVLDAMQQRISILRREAEQTSQTP